MLQPRQLGAQLHRALLDGVLCGPFVNALRQRKSAHAREAIA